MSGPCVDCMSAFVPDKDFLRAVVNRMLQQTFFSFCFCKKFIYHSHIIYVTKCSAHS